jgi:hypothetical protein
MSKPRPFVQRSLGRRTLLRGAGGVAVGLPFLDLMRPRRGDAAVESTRRFLVWFWGMGTVANQWEPQGAELDWKLSRILMPFTPVKQDIVVVKGLAAPGGYGHWHTSANMTGWKPGKAGDGKGFDGAGTTVDQELAKRWKDKTRLGHLLLGVAVPRNNDKNTSIISWAAKGQGLLPENSPYATYERLFGAAEGGAATADELKLLRARRRSVLDSALDNARRLEKQLGAEDRTRLDAYFQGVREIERKLDAPAATLPGGVCKRPDLAAGGAMIDFNSQKNVPQLMKLQHELAVAAFACDATRVISIQTDAAGTGRNHGPFLPGTDGGWHGISHEATAASIEKLVKINVWYNEQFVSLLQQMKAVNDGNGTLLDSALCWQMPEYGPNVPDGDTHQHQKLPYVLAGRCGGSVKTGRLLSFANKLPHNHLMIAIMRAFGFPDETFGDPQYKGALKGLVG